jgi:two-component system nitrate/nitrite response regulator NarL
MTPTVIIASSALLREGVTSLLQGTRFKVVSAVRNPAELANHKLTGRALAIVGIHWQNGSQDQAAENIRLLRSLMSDSKIVLVAETDGSLNLQDVTALSPDGYIINLGSRDMLVKSLELTLVGQQILMLGRPTGALTGDDTQRGTGALTNGKDDTRFPEGAVESQSGRTFGKTPHDMQLSHRERQVLTCLAHGESNKEIARVWDISEATVKVHLKAILRKINMRNRTQAAIWAIEHGLADADVASRMNGHAATGG